MRKFVIAVVVGTSALALLGTVVLFAVVSSTGPQQPEVPARVVPKGVPQPLVVSRRAPPTEATSEIVRVVATLPSAKGDVGRPFSEVLGLRSNGDERIRLGLARPGADRPPSDWSFSDNLHTGFDLLGIRPADSAEFLTSVSPTLAYDFLRMEGNWREDSERRRVAPADIDELYEEQRMLAEAIIAGSSPGSYEGRWARWSLLEAKVAATPQPERAQLIWDGAFELAEEASLGSFAVSVAIDSQPIPPAIQAHHHEVAAAVIGSKWGGFVTRLKISDYMLRDALRDGDQEWTGYWWSHVENTLPLPDGVWEGWEATALEVQAQLAGAVLAELDAAQTWQDGLRRAAVMCHLNNGPGTALDLQIEQADGAWRPLGATLEAEQSYADCVLAQAIPLPPQGQRAHLIVLDQAVDIERSHR